MVRPLAQPGSEIARRYTGEKATESVDSAQTKVRQAKLFPISGVVDLGLVGEGVSGAHWLGVYEKDGPTVYAAKCQNDQHPYLLLNEAVCAALADALQLPIPASRLIKFDHQLWFGLEKKGPKVVYTAQNLVACVNSDQVPDILGFDVLVCNFDRHIGNVVLHQFQEQPTAVRLWIIDHSHALVGTQQNVTALVATEHETQAYTRLPHHREVLHRRSQFKPFFDRLESLQDTVFHDVVGSFPPEFSPTDADLSSLIGFLIARRDEVRELLDTAFQDLPE